MAVHNSRWIEPDNEVGVATPAALRQGYQIRVAIIDRAYCGAGTVAETLRSALQFVPAKMSEFRGKSSPMNLNLRIVNLNQVSDGHSKLQWMGLTPA